MIMETDTKKILQTVKMMIRLTNWNYPPPSNSHHFQYCWKSSMESQPRPSFVTVAGDRPKQQIIVLLIITRRFNFSYLPPCCRASRWSRLWWTWVSWDWIPSTCRWVRRWWFQRLFGWFKGINLSTWLVVSGLLQREQQSFWLGNFGFEVYPPEN